MSFRKKSRDTMNKNYFLLMMGGVGSRFGADCPKQFVEINGKPIFSYILEKLNNNNLVSGVVVVCHESWVKFVKDYCGTKLTKVISVVQGGDCRSKSVFNGLKELRKIAKDDDVVLIHDATHPHLDETKLPELIEKVHEVGAATMCSCIYDTCYVKDEENIINKVIDRKTLAVGASPECFRFGLIYSIYDEATEEELERMTSAGATFLSEGLKMATVESKLLNLKITYQDDMDLFKVLVDDYYYKK